jgi:hypothetical protein
MVQRPSPHVAIRAELSSPDDDVRLFGSRHLSERFSRTS